MNKQPARVTRIAKRKSADFRPGAPTVEARANAFAALYARGQSVAEFARAHQLHPGTVYQVLSGEKKGRRGEAHRAAVLLGLKQGVA